VCCVDLGVRFYRARQLVASPEDSISTIEGGGSGGEIGWGWMSDDTGTHAGYNSGGVVGGQ
jgi:hypothetical protein